MEVKCTCPYCSKGFTIEVDAVRKKQVRNISDATRLERSQRMKEMRQNGIGGRAKGSRNSHPRSDKGVARKPVHAEAV